MNALTRQSHRWHDPFDLLSDLQEDFGRLFSPSLRTNVSENDRTITPSLEIHEDENQFTLSVDVPGIDRKNIDIAVTGNTLTLKGERSKELQKKKRGTIIPNEAMAVFSAPSSSPQKSKLTRSPLITKTVFSKWLFQNQRKPSPNRSKSTLNDDAWQTPFCRGSSRQKELSN